MLQKRAYCKETPSTDNIKNTHKCLPTLLTHDKARQTLWIPILCLISDLEELLVPTDESEQDAY